MKKSKKITQKRLKELLHYDPDTGIFKWKVQISNRIKIGDIAGCINQQNYIKIRIDGKIYASHRLVWLYMEGYFPENDIDHINQIKTDNRWKNLREISPQCNARNCGLYKNNKSKIKGVYWANTIKKWKVQIKIKQKTKYLGIYDNLDEAVCVRLAVEQCLNWEGCDNNSPAYQYVQKMINQ